MSGRRWIGAIGNRAGRARRRWHGVRAVRRAQAAFAPPPRGSFAALGARSYIVPPARVEHPECIEVGSDVLIHEHVWLMARPASGTAITIGDGTLITRFVKIVAMERVTIGEGAVIGDRGYISDVGYEPGHVDRRPGDRPLTAPAPVVIEREAFLGAGVVVEPGVTVGERAYIGASSVVTGDVPAGAVVAGNPARVLRSEGSPG